MTLNKDKESGPVWREEDGAGVLVGVVLCLGTTVGLGGRGGKMRRSVRPVLEGFSTCDVQTSQRQRK